MTCAQCDDMGTYLDPGCWDLTCAHSSRRKSTKEFNRERKALERERKASDNPGDLPEDVKRNVPRVMPCPRRVCGCPAGREARTVQKAAIRAQERHLARSGSAL